MSYSDDVKTVGFSFLVVVGMLFLGYLVSESVRANVSDVEQNKWEVKSFDKLNIAASIPTLRHTTDGGVVGVAIMYVCIDETEVIGYSISGDSITLDGKEFSTPIGFDGKREMMPVMPSDGLGMLLVKFANMVSFMTAKENSIDLIIGNEVVKFNFDLTGASKAIAAARQKCSIYGI